jgi:putative transposase
VKKPRYGGHIERLMGTASQGLKKVKGSTISDPKQRGENYDPQANAVMTLHELEQWLVLFFARYHHRKHGGIGMSPLQKYRDGLLGGNGRPPRGLPARRLDEEKVRLDFMPFVERTVQAYGVVIDDIYYFSDVLRRWVNAPDPDNPKASRVFRFKRDPRDISQLYFFDPDNQRYCTIPYRDLGKPPISLYELRSARKAAKDAGYKDIDEQVIFEFVNKMRDIEDKAAEKTRKARRDQQRRVNNEKARKKTKKDLSQTIATAEPAMPPEIPGYNPDPDAFFEED